MFSYAVRVKFAYKIVGINKDDISFNPMLNAALTAYSADVIPCYHCIFILGEKHSMNIARCVKVHYNSPFLGLPRFLSVFEKT